MHTCNAWCFGGVHALLFDTEATERPVIDQIAGRLANSAGLSSVVGWAEVRPPGSPAPGTPTAQGLARGRMVIWAR